MACAWWVACCKRCGEFRYACAVPVWHVKGGDMSELYCSDAYAPAEVAQRVETVGVAKASLGTLALRCGDAYSLPVRSVADDAPPAREAPAQDDNAPVVGAPKIIEAISALSSSRA